MLLTHSPLDLWDDVLQDCDRELALSDVDDIKAAFLLDDVGTVWILILPWLFEMRPSIDDQSPVDFASGGTWFTFFIAFKFIL